MDHRTARPTSSWLALLAVLAVWAWLDFGRSPSTRESAAAPTPEPVLRSASEVVIRGKKTLEAAIRAAMPTPVAGEPPLPVALVIDVTPNVVKRVEMLRSTIVHLDGDKSFARDIRLAPIGRGVGTPPKSLIELNKDISSATRKETPVVNTMAELRKSLATIREPTAVIYLCDWRFEDDFQVDALAADLADRKITFSCVGTEAAFSHAWTDGSVDPADRVSGRVPIVGGYFPGIGRSPFGKPVPDAPWHGGDSAYPPLPYRFHEMFWQTEFQKPSKSSPLKDVLEKLGGNKGGPGSPGVPGMEAPVPDEPEPPEDLGDRLGPSGFLALAEDAIRRYPIPSGYGPYGLMRLAAVTGGRYALWSWNPGGRTRVTYDYARCNLFGPDLRSRDRMLSEIAANPLPAATMEAWHALLATDGLVSQTPPLDDDLKTPRTIDDVYGNSEFRLTWDNHSDWKLMRRALVRAVSVVTAARKRLEPVIAAAAEPGNDLERRRLADARLFEFTIRVLEFELNELDLATKDVKPELWRTTPKGKIPGACSNNFILGSGNPLADFIGLSTLGDDEKALDSAAGERIARARKEHIERYRGTPFGAQVELADVSTFRVVEWEKGKPFSRGGTPSESGGTKPGPNTPTPPPGTGSSGGGGPTTGK